MKQPKLSTISNLIGYLPFPLCGASAGRRNINVARANPSGSREGQAKRNRTPLGVLFLLVTLSGLEPEFAP